MKDKETDDWVSLDYYLIWLGERSAEYSYTKEVLLENIDYFKQCWTNKLSAYKALEFFSCHLDPEYFNKIEKL